MDEIEVSFFFEELHQLEYVRVLQTLMDRCLSIELLLDLLSLLFLERSNQQFLKDEELLQRQQVMSYIVSYSLDLHHLFAGACL